MEFFCFSLNVENLLYFFYGNLYFDVMFFGSCFENERKFNMFVKYSLELLD